MPADPHPDHLRAVALLAPTLGEDKAREVVLAAESALGLRSFAWAEGDLPAVLGVIAKESGLVGITARVLARRLVLGGAGAHSAAGQAAAGQPSTAHAATGQAATGQGATPAPAPARSGGRGKPLAAIAALLENGLGEDRARVTIALAAKRLGLGAEVTLEEAKRLLHEVGREEGVVGITASFAATRLHLLSW